MSNTQSAVPPNWYDLSCRVSSAKTVANYILEALPSGKDAIPVMNQINETGNLACAVIELLNLIESDVNLLEQQLRATH